MKLHVPDMGRAHRRALSAAGAALLVAACTPQAGLQDSRLPTIVRGELVRAGEYPFTVALRHNIDRSQFCTGAVVADYWVLTAEHCLREPRSGGFYVSTGRGPDEVGQFLVAEQIPYPLGQRDIMLLRTATQITSPAVPAAPISTWTPTTGDVTAVGWGLTSRYPESVPKRLWKVRLPIASCPAGTRGGLFCAFDSTRRVAFGDSGGPALTGDPKNATLVGVTVRSAGQHSEFEASSEFYDWVRQTIGR